MIKVGEVRQRLIEITVDKKARTTSEYAIQIFGESSRSTRAKVSNALTANKWFSKNGIVRHRKNKGDLFLYSQYPGTVEGNYADTNCE